MFVRCGDNEIRMELLGDGKDEDLTYLIMGESRYMKRMYLKKGFSTCSVKI
jgi:hypothetical protein